MQHYFGHTWTQSLDACGTNNWCHLFSTLGPLPANWPIRSRPISQSQSLSQLKQEANVETSYCFNLYSCCRGIAKGTATLVQVENWTYNIYIACNQMWSNWWVSWPTTTSTSHDSEVQVDVKGPAGCSLVWCLCEWPAESRNDFCEVKKALWVVLFNHNDSIFRIS